MSATGVSLFCVFNLFKEEKGQMLAGKGAVYGDSIWVSATPKTTKAEPGYGPYRENAD